MQMCLITCVLIVLVIKYHLTNALNLKSNFFPKCCGKGEQLKTDFKTCLNTDEESFFPYDIGFLSSKTLKPIPLAGDLSVRYDSKPKCNFEVVPFTDSVMLFDNSSLLIQKHGNFTFQSDSYCMDRVYIDRTWPLYRTAPSDHTFAILLCPCLNRFCVRKCCLGERVLNVSLQGGNIFADCVDFTGGEVWRPMVKEDTADYFISHGLPSCPAGVYLLNKSSSNASFRIIADGSVEFYGGKIPADEYCTDRSLVHGEITDNLFACLQPPPGLDKRDPIVYATFFAIGSVFLLITLVLHLWLHELRKSVHSFNLIMHVASLFLGYVALAVGNFELLQAPSVSCIILAYIIQFSFLAAFFWLNVLCADISWTFSGLRVLQGSTLTAKERRKILLYSVYAWSGTALISGATALLEYTPILSQHSKLKPNFGERVCWFKYPESTIAYFYGPMGVLLLCNLLLFLYTTVKICLAHKDTSILQREGSYRHDGQDEHHRFLLYLKLFLLMGVTWIFEIVSWSVYKSNVIWYATDFVNVLRGFFIFLLFCMKKKIFYILKSKFSNKTNQSRPPTNRSVSRTSITTQSSNFLQLSQIK